MHPEISRFPSKLFYNARLLDGPDMALATKAPWHSLRAFPPYCFYNVEEGVEKSGSGQSFYNSAEAEAAVTLVDLLAARLPDVKVNYYAMRTCWLGMLLTFLISRQSLHIVSELLPLTSSS